jgi:hypothetical protein
MVQLSHYQTKKGKVHLFFSVCTVQARVRLPKSKKVCFTVHLSFCIERTRTWNVWKTGKKKINLFKNKKSMPLLRSFQ